MYPSIFVFLCLIFLTLFGSVYSQCDNCMNGMPMTGCVSPSLCGFSPFDCKPCKPIHTANCSSTLAGWCANVTCNGCMDGMPMKGCKDPGLCGFEPIACKGCLPGKNTTGCPKPEWCAASHGTFPCYKCADGKVSKDECPDPYKCGFKPACDDCMAGMAMAGCPDPDVCAALGMGCVMQMYFNLNESTCVLVKRWNISARGDWALAIILIILAAYAREGVAFYRSYRLSARKKAKAQNKSKYNHVDNSELKNSLLKDNAHVPSSSSSSSSSSAPWYSHAIDSFCYCLQQTLSYLLMLVIMTYNFYLFIAVILAFSVAHFTINYSWEKAKQLTNQSTHRSNESINFNNNPSNNNNNNVSVVRVDDPEQKTGGDHCCEDFEFDD